MSRVEEIEMSVRNLSLDELKTFRDWFAGFDAEIWDRQIEADAKNGKLKSLAEGAMHDHEAGRSTEM
jgi:hypothetical protein